MKKAIILFNLGTPDKLENLEPFLFNLFSDNEIFKIPLAFPRKIAAKLIAKIRKKTAKRFYEAIGGESPLLRHTKLQAALLEKLLKKENNNTEVYYAMRYWHPFIEDILNSLINNNIGKIILLPLYPQFSYATTGSFIKHFKRVLIEKNIENIEIAYINSYHNDSLFIKGIVDKLEEAIKKEGINSFEKTAIILSAHSLPRFLVKAKDPYPQQINETVEYVSKEIRERISEDIPIRLAFQSRLKFYRWLKPTVIDVIKEIHKKCIKNIIVVPISFVSDNIETLYELGIAVRETAFKIGIEKYILAECLNENENFIKCLYNIVKKI